MALEKILKNSSGVPTGEYETVAGGTLYASAPIGTIFATMSATAPVGFLLCDGTAYRKADYPELWEILPSTVKDTTNNTFTIDLREVALKGAGLTGHTVGNHLDADGLAVGEFLDDRIQNGNLNVSEASGGSGNVLDLGNAATVLITPLSAVLPNIRTGATTEVKSVGVNYIIKAKMVAVPADLASGVEEYIDEKFEVEDLSSQISSTVASGMLCYKCGKTVTLVLYNVLVTSNGRITGVPKNANIATGTLISSDATASGYLSIGGIGDNYINVNTGATNKYYYGSITYFTND